MTFIVANNVDEQLRKISQLNNTEVSCSFLIGTINQEENEVEILSAMQFIPQPSNSTNFGKSTIEEVSQTISSFNIMLPENLSIIGIVIYEDNVKPEEFFSWKKDRKELSRLICFGQFSNEKKLTLFSLLTKDVDRIKYKIKPVALSNKLSFIYTLEVEIPKKLLGNISELKKTILDIFLSSWNKTSCNRKDELKIRQFCKFENPLERIIEIVIPSEELDFGTATAETKRHLAFDLHSSLYPTKSFMNKTIKMIKPSIKQALKKDLIIKLQRSIYDEREETLLFPKKIPVHFQNIELTGYLSKHNPSRFEYNVCVQLIEHCRMLDKIGDGLAARVLLRDLLTYFSLLEDDEKIEKITQLTKKMIKKKS
jgi:hypothetical protein